MKTTNDVTAFIKPILVIIEALVKGVKELYHYPLIDLLNWHIVDEDITPLFRKYYNIFRELVGMLWSANKMYLVRIIDNKEGFVYFYSIFHDFELNQHKTFFIEKFKIEPTDEDVRYLYDIYLSSSLGYYTLYSGEDEEDGRFYITDNHIKFIETLFEDLYSDYEDATCEVDTLNLYDNAGEALYTYNPLHKSGNVFHFNSEQDYIEEMQYELKNNKLLKILTLQNRKGA